MIIRISRIRRQHRHTFFLTSTRASSKCPTTDGDGYTTPSLLDVSVVLSPGKFCKAPNATILDASKRLVDGRRKFVQSLRNDLKLNSNWDRTSSNSCSSSIGASNSTNSTRKIYALVGHGVPTGLLYQLCDAAKGWLGMRQRTKATSHNNNNNDGDDDAQQQEQQSQQYDQISFTNVPNTALLDTERIYCTISSNPQLSTDNDDTNNHSDDSITTLSPTTTTSSQEVLTLSSLPTEWDYDIEMYMVVMDRIASRMASIAFMAHPLTHTDSIGIKDETIIVTPSQLIQYNVTITRGSATFLSSDGNNISSLATTTTPTAFARSSVGNDRRKNQRRRRSIDNTSNEDTAIDASDLPPQSPTLTLEYVQKSNGSANQTTMSDESNDDDYCCWKVILKLHDHQPPMGKSIHHATTNTSVSLIFEGEYVLPV